jgi:hypothetical protein
MIFKQREPQRIVVSAMPGQNAGHRECANRLATAGQVSTTAATRPINQPRIPRAPNASVTDGLNHCAWPQHSGSTSLAGLVASTTRSASQTRVLALALQRNPFPSFTKQCCETRWQVGPDSVRTILRVWAVDPGPVKSLRIPLTDVLLCEGFSDPLAMWISASPELRKILSADLLTLEEWLAQASGEEKRDETKYYRDLAEGRLASVRIGNQHRFRPTLEAALCGPAIDREKRS